MSGSVPTSAAAGWDDDFGERKHSDDGAQSEHGHISGRPARMDCTLPSANTINAAELACACTMPTISAREVAVVFVEVLVGQPYVDGGRHDVGVEVDSSPWLCT